MLNFVLTTVRNFSNIDSFSSRNALLLKQNFLIFFSELTTILSPTWNYRISFANVDPPTLGSLVLIIDENVEKCPSSKELVPMIEACLYLVWQHLNLFFNTLEVSPEQRVEVNKLKAESAGIATDLFFSKIQNSIKVCIDLWFIF